MIKIEEDIRGKVVIITGGSQGIGKGCAEVFCAYGANVVICARGEELGRRVAGELTEKGPGKCLFFRCDVSDAEQVRELVEFTVKQFGKLDCLINNAAQCPAQRPIDEIPIEETRHLFQTNFIGLFAGCKYALPYLRSSKGSIINIGSILGAVGQEGSTIYSATKGAISTFTKSLAMDEARNGVRVNNVKPGHIVTEIYERNKERSGDPEAFEKWSNEVQWLGRGGEPEEIGYTCLFLASRWAGFTTGTDVYATGGYELGEGHKVTLFDWDAKMKKA